MASVTVSFCSVPSHRVLSVEGGAGHRGIDTDDLEETLDLRRSRGDPEVPRNCSGVLSAYPSTILASIDSAARLS